MTVQKTDGGAARCSLVRRQQCWRGDKDGVWRARSAIFILQSQVIKTIIRSITSLRTTMSLVTTDSGLQYDDITVGEGDEAVAGMQVTVHYTGWLQDADGNPGKKFDSSKDRGTPFQFPLGGGRVIEGWDEGVQGMKVGGLRRLVIPGELGYGPRGAGRDIGPNATLIFDVELLAV
jgi:FKBP-type peptidyl-prolyl cis-trans isomerase FkpA